MNNRKKIYTDVIFNPQNYLSYNDFIQYAEKSLQPRQKYSGIARFAVVCYPHPLPDTTLIFVIDGGKFHKKLKHRNICLSPMHLLAYGKTEEEFFDDWQKAHNK
ncbi:MAG: hypothetical protein J6J44_14570 [Lachnospiraceae bacterium]|nr:hypothetical protein [Lachnospiraceae bacterium]